MEMTDPHSLPYRLGVGLVLFNREGLVWVGRRLDQKGEAWQMPQGGVDEGETPEQAALRELEEEIGTGKAEIVGETRGWLTYELPPELVGVAWKGRYRGQKQKWFALRFTGTDADIRIDTEHPEFAEWRWVAFDRLVELIVPFKRELYVRVCAEFAELARNMRP
jgi:putative (di)nucleoside polyphosphate hydrolase